MITFPFAKINLGLNIVSKRDDGYHNIETVFFPVHGLTDILEIVESDRFSFTQTGLHIDSATEDNLCVKAYHILKKDFKLPPVSICLHKIIPAGAGLGGGSSDASSTLLVLNRIFGLDVPRQRLMSYAAMLGSDCAFFIDGIPSFASGRGEQLEHSDANIYGMYILLVKPDVHVSTARAYSGVVPKKPLLSLRETVTRPLQEWKEILTNDFEKNIFWQYPAIAAIKEKMYRQGALYASMSGSGATVFGLFRDEPDCSGFGNDMVFCGKLFKADRKYENPGN
jgi:4-diphosphocytidyl-2-C-methyl-D-erythritol kinase